MIEPQTFDLTALATDPRTSGNQRVIRLSIDPEVIAVERPGWPPYQLRWDDPKLEFAVVDYRTVPTGGFVYRHTYPNGTPTLFTLILGSADTLLRSLECPRPIWIPLEAYEALKAAALGLGLHLYRGPAQHNGPSEAIVWDFRRKKILLEKDFNPSATG